MFKKLKENKQITNEKRFIKEQVNSPFVQFTMLTRKLIREFLCHNEYSVIGRVKITKEADHTNTIDFNLQRFTFENTSELGLMLFAFSDEDSLDNFQNQIKGKVMETAELSSPSLIPILNKMKTEKSVKYYADGNEQVTAGIVVDPSLPCYFVLNKEKFSELPSLFIQLTIESILRKIQYEQLNPIWPSDISDTTVNTLFPKLLEYEDFHVFLLEDENTKTENLLTITLNHPEIIKNEYNSKRNSFIYIPIYTDIGTATDSISLLEYYYSEQLNGQSISVVTMKGENLIEWLRESKDTHGLMFNPKEEIYEGNVKLPEDVNPNLHPKKAVPKTSEHQIMSSEYYDLPDWPLLPYLCVLKRSSLFDD